MKRLTISIDDDLAERFEALVRERGYVNRSEAFRDLLRQEIDADAIDHGAVGRCVATLSYVFDHHERRLAERLLVIQHDHHDLIVSTTHVHIDHDHCLETTLLRGPIRAVERFGSAIISEKGVRHGKLHVVPVTADAGRSHPHVHDRPHS